ncbi:ABC-type glycerol-3-phosphate transport system, substrate-binding protein [Devosia crocina]|uniref:ABC-type glycerol-3-phosphate transport system, substrate-binding protein n=1 Tax=Devosia crocina TaxID=429728 RepID=A0A1I7NVQ7_9HYPH|nr:sugar ABC transporter substrate-binding protein [Devosia crocina]SFV38678.1 ABC-type glycerol-3-phosphate transport system, substrate-binding protein [Devosia crocina]
MKILRLATLAALAGTCGVAAQEQVTLRYMQLSVPALEAERPVIAAFEAANPGVRIEAQAMPSSEYWRSLSARAAAGDLPDVMAMSSAFVQQWARAGNLSALDEYLAEVDTGAFYESALGFGQVDGSTFAFPQNWVAPVLYFNKDAFDAAGVEYPTTAWSWEDFRAAAKALTIDENGDGRPEQWGFWFDGRYTNVEPWIFRNAGLLLTEDRAAIDPTPEAIKAMEFLVSLVMEEKSAPMPKDLEGIRPQDVFGLGMAAMWVDGSWQIDNNRQVIADQFEWGMSEVPLGPDATEETARVYAWADMLSVTKDSAHQDLAWQFVLHMSGPGRQASDFPGGKVPAYIPVAQDRAWLEEGMLPAEKSLLLEMGGKAAYSGFSDDWSAWRGYGASGSGGMNGELDEVLNGRKALDDALAAAVAYGNDILSR